MSATQPAAEPQAYVNGRWLPASQASIGLADAGFVLGATVTEQIRTFAGRLFRLDEHLARLTRGLAITGISPGLSRDELREIAQQLAAANHRLLPAGSDLGLAILVTPGPYGSFASGPGRPTVVLHTYPLAFARWAGKYRTGEMLAATTIELVSPKSWPAELKCRSRMHYYLADLEAGRKHPGARAVLCDAAGRVRETAVANIVLGLSSEGRTTLVSPPRTSVLPGISLGVVAEFAAERGWGFEERDFTLDDLVEADEVFLTSTPWCVLPATQFEGRAIGSGSPGPIFTGLMEAWNRLAGIDLIAQAEEAAKPEA